VRKRLLVSKVEDFNFCPLRRIRHPFNQQKVRIWRWSGRKNKYYYVRSLNVYENKENMDKVAAKKSDIYGNSTWILQRNSEFEGQFTLIRTFGAGFVRIFAAKSSHSPAVSSCRLEDRRERRHSRGGALRVPASPSIPSSVDDSRSLFSPSRMIKTNRRFATS